MLILCHDALSQECRISFILVAPSTIAFDKIIVSSIKNNCEIEGEEHFLGHEGHLSFELLSTLLRTLLNKNN